MGGRKRASILTGDWRILGYEEIQPEEKRNHEEQREGIFVAAPKENLLQKMEVLVPKKRGRKLRRKRSTNQRN